MSVAGLGAKGVGSRGAVRRGVGWWCLAFMAPSLILAGMFTFWPMVASWYYSLLQWSGFAESKHFIGLANYRELVQDHYFWSAFGRSFLFTAVTIPVKLVLALIVAIVLNDASLRLAPIFRTFLFIPVVTTTAIVGILMTILLSPSHGAVNDILMDLRIIHAPINFLGDPKLGLWSIMGVFVWKSFGVSMIYWLAALQSIPKDVYEAAKVDGASWWRTHVHITAPLLAPFAIVITLITAVQSLRVFDLIQTMTGGGPFYATETVEIYIYRTAFSVLGGGVPRLGYASAAGVLFGVALMIVALVQVWIGARVRPRRQRRAAEEAR
jgi:multiple sugar transport system permease protein